MAVQPKEGKTCTRGGRGEEGDEKVKWWFFTRRSDALHAVRDGGEGEVRA